MQNDRLSLVVGGCLCVPQISKHKFLQISYDLQAIWITIAANGKNMYEIFNNMITIRLLLVPPVFHLSVCFLLVCQQKITSRTESYATCDSYCYCLFFLRLSFVVRMPSSLSFSMCVCVHVNLVKIEWVGKRIFDSFALHRFVFFFSDFFFDVLLLLFFCFFIFLVASLWLCK